jgi:hypothetical protein
MDIIISDQNARHEPAVFIVMRPDPSIADPGTLRLRDAEVSARLPRL